MSAISLNIGKVYYDSKKYDEAINYFSSLLNKKDDAVLNLWIGKCYFNKTETFSFYYLPNISGFKYGVSFSHPGLPIKAYSERKMTRVALSYFNAALKNDPCLIEAHFWKGKVLESEGEIEDAYMSYISAAKLAKDRFYLEKCISMYSCHKNLSFIETIPLETISIEEALKAIDSDEPYTRMEGFQSLSYYLENSLNTETMKKINRIVSACAGHKLYCFYVPCTGDTDARIRSFVRSLMEKIESTETSLSLVSESSQQAYFSI